MNYQDIDKLLKVIATIREVGNVGLVGRLIEKARTHVDAESATSEIADHEAWFEWATEHERAHGRDSLLDRQHPVHLNAMRMVRSVKKNHGCGG